MRSLTTKKNLYGRHNMDSDSNYHHHWRIVQQCIIHSDCNILCYYTTQVVPKVKLSCAWSCHKTVRECRVWSQHGPHEGSRLRKRSALRFRCFIHSTNGIKRWMYSNNFIEHQGPLQSLQKHNIDHILRQINPTYTVIFKYHLTLYAIRLRLPRDRSSFFSHNLITVSKLSQPCYMSHPP